MTEAHTDGPLTLPVDPTGVRGLDNVLGGGLPRRALALVTGPPGSGKTTLSAQVAVAAARAGRPALIVTAFAESPDKLIAHLRTYRFFDANLLGDGLQILSLGSFLDEGMTRLSAEVITLLRGARAGLLILDGFDGVRGLDPDPQAARRFLYDIGNAAAALGATTLVTSIADSREGPFAAQATVADVLLRLSYELVGMRERRRLEVIKVRGAASLPGLHALTLGADGVAVYPRLEARITSTRRGEPPGLPTRRAEDTEAPRRRGGGLGDSQDQRAGFGLPDLDALLGGGLAGTTTLLGGGLGTGKTLLGLHFALSGVAEGAPVVLVSFRDSRRELHRLAAPFGLESRLQAALEPGGGLTLLDVDVPPVELDPDVLADQLLEILAETGARRLVVDSAVDLERAVAMSSGRERVDDYLAAFTAAVRVREISTLFIKELPTAQSGAVADEGLAARVDNILLLLQEECDGRLQRTLLIAKARFAARDAARYLYTITAPMGLSFDVADTAKGHAVAAGQGRS